MTGTVSEPRLSPAAAVDVARGLAPGFAERAAAYDAEGAFPAEDFAQIREAGLLALLVPERLGGSGGGFADYVEVAMLLAAGNGSTALIYNMHASVTGTLALTSDDVARALGVPESFFAMRDRVLRQAVDGALFAVAMSERGAGSRLSQLATRYVRTPAGFHVTGSKAFCSGAGHADAYVVAARAAGDDGAMSQFLVDASLPGITVEETWDSLGMRATGSHDIHLDVDVPEDALLGGIEGLGVLIAQAMPQWLVASYAGVYVGVAQAAVDAAVEQIRARGLERLPAVRARVGRADAAVAAAREVVRQAAVRVDSAPGSPDTNRWVWRAKLLAGETAMAVAASMLEACGTGATRRGNDLERLYRDARCGSLQPATSDVCADWLGLATLGLDPDNQAEVPRW
jgi:alkylation response protein AidB-like acyl-CoA dehydrogenase